MEEQIHSMKSARREQCNVERTQNDKKDNRKNAKNEKDEKQIQKTSE